MPSGSGVAMRGCCWSHNEKEYYTVTHWKGKKLKKKQDGGLSEYYLKVQRCEDRIDSDVTCFPYRAY